MSLDFSPLLLLLFVGITTQPLPMGRWYPSSAVRIIVAGAH